MSDRAYRRDQANGHAYILNGAKLPGVTTILNGGLPKPALVGWAGNTVASYAIDHWRELARMPVSQRLKMLTGAPYRDRDEAGKRGTEIHRLAEAIHNGQEVAVPSDIAGHVESYRRFLREWKVEVIAAELAVFSEKYGYAGTTDLFAVVGGIRSIVDLKSNRSGPFSEPAFQLAAYRYADFALDSEGNEIPVPEVERALVVWVRSDGYNVYPYTADKRVHRMFLSIMETYEAATESKYFKGESISPPVVVNAQ